MKNPNIQKPMFKTIYTPVTRHHNIIQIGFESKSLEIEDNDGFINELIKLLNGHNTIEQISAKIKCPVDEVEEIIYELDYFGLIENNDSSTIDLNQDDLERYRSNINYFSNFSSMTMSKFTFQRNLKNATVAVLGLGGTSAIIAAFAGMGVGKIIGVDYDTVERSNLNRQFLFSENDLGRLKTEAVYDRLKAINPDIEVENHNLKIEDDQCLSDIIKEADLVINGIDQPAILATRWVNAACVKERKPFIQGGISNTKIMWQQFSPDGGCYDCYIINALQSDSTFKYQIQSVYGQSFDKRNTAFAPNVLLLSGYLGMEVAKLLGKYAPPISKSLTTEVDTITQKRTELGQWHKIENCPTCGTNNKDRMLMDLEELLMFADLGDDSCQH